MDHLVDLNKANKALQQLNRLMPRWMKELSSQKAGFWLPGRIEVSMTKEGAWSCQAIGREPDSDDKLLRTVVEVYGESLEGALCRMSAWMDQYFDKIDGRKVSN